VRAQDDPARRHYLDVDDAAEVALPSGDVTEGVVRVGGTVRRPHQGQSIAVAGYLDHLEQAGFEASPRYLGRDRQGRDVLTFLPGDVPGTPPERWARDDRLLASVARLLRRLHAASEGFAADRRFAAPPGSAWRRDLVRVDLPAGVVDDVDEELVSHLDVTPQNVVVRCGEAVGLIDFDLAGPTSRLVDAFNTAMHWVPLRDPRDVWPQWSGVDQLARLRTFADAYGLDAAEREALPDVGIVRADVSWCRMQAAAVQLGGGWRRMWDEGVGDLIRRRQDWLRARRPDIVAALR
jgi:Ser/Thr protein kinase RdoA (MazF antagonist)